MKMKLSEEGSKILKELLIQNEENTGPFSKTSNVMLALEPMQKGEELASNQVTKNHLTNIIKVLCTKLEWVEEPSDQEEVKNEASQDISTENESNASQKVCKFFRSGNCKFGRSGKKSGLTCAYSHSITCKKFELYGNKHPKGCKDKKCDKLHLSLCKIYTKFQNCKYGEKCRYFHPRKLKPNNQIKEEHSDQTFGKYLIMLCTMACNPNRPFGSL